MPYHSIPWAYGRGLALTTPTAAHGMECVLSMALGYHTWDQAVVHGAGSSSQATEGVTHDDGVGVWGGLAQGPGIWVGVWGGGGSRSYT